MPELSRFMGVVIRMFYADHPPPHFHVYYGDDVALIDIRTRGTFAGRLPPRVLGYVVEWASLHQEELLDNWRHAENGEPLHRIEPL
jgi:hypothetical protein